MPAKIASFRVADDPGASAPDQLVLMASCFGDPSNRPVLLAHGGGQTRHSWQRSAAQLATAGMYAIAYDQRGHGDSGWSPSQRYCVDAFADDLAAIANSLDRPPIVIGASLGGLAALLASRFTDFAALVLVDITPRQSPEGVSRIVNFMLENAVDGFESLDHAADAVASYQPHRARRSSVEGLKKNLRLGPDQRWRWHWDPMLFNESSGLRDAQRSSSLAQCAEALTIPTMLVRGSLSDLVTPETAAEFLALVPHAHYRDVSDAGHMVAGDNNDAFAAAVVAFVTTLPS